MTSVSDVCITSSYALDDKTTKQSLCLTTCPYCGVGCGVEVTKTVSQQALKSVTSLSNLKGRSDHPANFGRLCVKGSNLLETNDLSGRLLSPMIDQQDVSWDVATAKVAKVFKQTIEQYGPDSVAFYVSGQLLTEDYYVANKLMKGYIGSANIDTNSRLCMSSAVAAYKRAFGSDTVPCNYEDLEQTQYLVLIGSNAAWTHPVLFQRIERAKKLNPAMQIVVVDPRRTNTCELADLHLPIKAGTDAYLFNGLLSYLNEGDYLDSDFIAENTEGFSNALQQATELSFSEIAEICEIEYQLLLQFYEGFAKSSRSISFYSMGINQSTSGVDKANAIINCHLATGKIGSVGNGPFSITGQPNAMGGREVGGLANMLAAHMDIANPDHRELVQTFWDSPTIPTENGLKAVDLFEQIEQGKVKAVWIMATNPLVSMPNRSKIESALEKCPFVVVSDVVKQNDTIKYADVALPATAWSEKDGTVTNSERRISRQKAILPAPSKSKHDWQIICDVAIKMGFEEGFNFSSPHEVFDEHARLSAYRNNGSRDFDISGLIGLSKDEYDCLLPVQWPINDKYPNGRARMFDDGRFFTPSQKAQFISIVPRMPEQLTNEDFPIVLNTGRLRDQWHTMTRTGKAASLTEHISESFVFVHPKTAKHLGLKSGQLAKLTAATSANEVLLRVMTDSGLQRDTAFAPIHFSLSNTSASSIASLFSDANDPISGQPELKHAAVKLDTFEYQTDAVLFSNQELSRDLLSAFEYWSSSKIDGAYRYRIASVQGLDFIDQLFNSFVSTDASVFRQQKVQCFQAVATEHDKLSLCLFAHSINPDSQQGYIFESINNAWLSDAFCQDTLNNETIGSLLRINPSEEFTAGKLICSCFKVRDKTIETAISEGCTSVEQLGDQLRCGTNCGSCKTELKAMINAHQAIQVLEVS